MLEKALAIARRRDAPAQLALIQGRRQAASRERHANGGLAGQMAAPGHMDSPSLWWYGSCGTARPKAAAKAVAK